MQTKYRGKYPNALRSITSGNRGRVIHGITNDGHVWLLIPDAAGKLPDLKIPTIYEWPDHLRVALGRIEQVSA
jgi:hypothetical protein